MGLDVVLFDKKGKQVDIFEVSESLHKAIFNSNNLWKSYIELRRLSDYYLTDETLLGKRLIDLISELQSYKPNILTENLNEYEGFINKLTSPDVVKGHIAGD
ncbi:hypothetical protein FZW96_20975 [Bacillus sp. BGMRC 2118]|nr:hypothetical protein FZW96_20975 [Bacillus sp. BGMRC 2118]